MKIAIIVREETMQRCSCSGCMSAFFARKDSFACYGGMPNVELVSFTHNGGDLEKKIATLVKNSVDVVHLSSCMRAKDPGYAELARRLSQHFAVVGYTHGEENGKSGPAIILDRES